MCSLVVSFEVGGVDAKTVWTLEEVVTTTAAAEVAVVVLATTAVVEVV